MALKINPLTPGFGAELSGVDIAKPLSGLDRAVILRAMDDYSVIAFHDTGLDDESHVAFSRIFGHVEAIPSFHKLFKGDKASAEGAPAEYGRYISGITNLTADGQIVTDPERRMLYTADRLWHTDSSFVAKRAGYSALLAYVVPPVDGNTEFADLRAAYDDLPPAMKARIDGLEAEHCFWWSRRRGGYDISEEEAMKMPAARQPLVITLPSGRKSLCLASHIRAVVGMDLAEGRALVDELTAFATQPRYVFSYKWRAGDLVVWSNLATVHRAAGYDDLKYPRNMRRTTIRAPGYGDGDEGNYLDMYGSSLDQMGRSADLASP
jgi:alpha-ketoglutarate-dependent 2,4-dichlorophenoxyacetate dioxygenase